MVARVDEFLPLSDRLGVSLDQSDTAHRHLLDTTLHAALEPTMELSA